MASHLSSVFSCRTTQNKTSADSAGDWCAGGALRRLRLVTETILPTVVFAEEQPRAIVVRPL